MYDLLNEVNSKLQDLVNNTDDKNEQDIKRTKNYLSALSDHIDTINKEREFSLNEEQDKILKRGNIVWVDFGFNIGSEFGGRHPAIILKRLRQINQILVIPLDSSSDNPITEQKRESSDYWIKIQGEEIWGMQDNIVRWANVFNIAQISNLRVDFFDLNGNYKFFSVDYEVLDRIDRKVEIFGYNSFQKKSKKHLTNNK
jgi:uncharacterized protein YifN (PemK superfamily)